MNDYDGMPNLPKIMSMADLAILIGWRVERVRRAMAKRGIAFKMAERKNCRWYVTSVGLRQSMPQVYMEVQAEAGRRSYVFSD